MHKFKARRCLVVVVDAFDLAGTFPAALVAEACSRAEEVIFLVNKYDLLNKTYVNLTAIRKQLEQQVTAAGGSNPKIHLTSASTKAGLKHLKDMLV
jgi:predicted GTPase